MTRLNQTDRVKKTTYERSSSNCLSVFSALRRRKISKKSYSENQAIVEKFWKQYQKDNNPKWLAEICLNVPFFDHPEVAEELARLIKKTAQ